MIHFLYLNIFKIFFKVSLSSAVWLQLNSAIADVGMTPEKKKYASLDNGKGDTK